jgi:hypothetical protein
MVSFLAHKRQCTLVLMVVALMLLVGLLSSPTPALAQSAVTVDPTEGAPGTDVTATGSGWSAGHQVSVQWDDGTVHPGQRGKEASLTVAAPSAVSRLSKGEWTKCYLIIGLRVAFIWLP